MSVTAVPLHPIAKGSLTKLWVGLAAVALAGGALAWSGVADVRTEYQTNEQFLAENAAQDGVKTTPSGLQYRIVREGTGPAAAEGQWAIISYVGKLRDGTEFDANPQAPFPVGAGQAIPGFDEGLKLLKKGSKIEYWIKPELAYGDRDMPNPQTGEVVIPANSLLHFEVEGLDIMSDADFRKKVAEMQKAMGAAKGGAGAPPPAGQ